MAEEIKVTAHGSGVVGQSSQSVEQKAERLPAQQFCLFRAGCERYCLSVTEVEEVVEWPALTRIPLAPSFLMGIFNLRGVIVPVLDIASREERNAEETPSHLVVAAWKNGPDRPIQRVALAADEMLGTCLTTEPLLVEEAPKEALHCRGMLRHDDRLALALDPQRLSEAFPIPAV